MENRDASVQVPESFDKAFAMLTFLPAANGASIRAGFDPRNGHRGNRRRKGFRHFLVFTVS
jgi:hypothetical protein